MTRYDMEVGWTDHGDEFVDERKSIDGEWVRYEDAEADKAAAVQALEADLAALRAEHARLTAEAEQREREAFMAGFEFGAEAATDRADWAHGPAIDDEDDAYAAWRKEQTQV